MLYDAISIIWHVNPQYCKVIQLKNTCNTHHLPPDVPKTAGKCKVQPKRFPLSPSADSNSFTEITDLTLGALQYLWYRYGVKHKNHDDFIIVSLIKTSHNTACTHSLHRPKINLLGCTIFIGTWHHYYLTGWLGFMFVC